MTEEKIELLRAAYPWMGEPTLRKNAAILLGYEPGFVSTTPPPAEPTNAPPTVIATQAAPKPTPVVKAKRKRVERTRNLGTWTESQYWCALRSQLRRAFRFWKPALAALKAARVSARGPRGKKWAYRCANCTQLFGRKDVQIDHKVACGSLTSLDDIGPFLSRLTVEDPNAFQVLCKHCHSEKTAIDRGNNDPERKPSKPRIQCKTPAKPRSLPNSSLERLARL